MEEPKITQLDIKPGFDLENFLNFTHETKISTQALENFIDLWTEWQTKLQAVQIQAGQNSWLAIWLPEEVEEKIDKAWEISPAEGYLINGLAQFLCMAAVEDVLPQAAEGGCAAAPKPHPALTKALHTLELVNPAKDATALTRKFAILTYFPFKGGCEICAMQENCPKSNGHQEFASVVLPGYERGSGD